MNDKDFEKICRDFVNNQYDYQDKADELKQRMKNNEFNKTKTINSKEDLNESLCKYRYFQIGDFKIVANNKIPVVYMETNEKNMKIDRKVKNLERIVVNQDLLHKINIGVYTNQEFLEFLYYILKYDKNKYLF